MRCKICLKIKIYSDDPVTRESYIEKYGGICTCSNLIFYKIPLEEFSKKKPSLDDYDLCSGNAELEDEISYYEKTLDEQNFL